MTYKISLLYNVYDQVMAEMLLCLLQNIGIEVESIIEQRSGDDSGLCFFCYDKKKWEDTYRKLSLMQIKGVSIKKEKLFQKDWQEKWKKGLQAFNITKKIRVIPFWEQDQYIIDKSRDIVIDTTSTFGIGTHPTTRLMCQFIESLEGEFEEVFDVGTGTGILSIVAAKYGARKIWAIDIDKKSVDVAKHNMTMNGYEPDHIQCCDFKEFSSAATFDMVLANVLTKDLLKEREKLIRYVVSGKYLVVSGIEENNYQHFRKYFDGDELEHIKTKILKNWRAVLYRVKR